MKISVVIPTFNMASTLKRAIESALPQADEVIVINDGSTDETRDVLQSINHPRLLYANFEANAGVCRSRNTAIGLSRCDWFVPLDADDVLLPGALNALRNEASARWFVYGDWLEKIDGQIVRKPASPIGMLDRKNVAKATFLFSRAMWQEVGGYDSDFERTGGEDWAFMCALVNAGFRGAKVDAPIYQYTVRTDGRAARVVEHAEEVMALLKAKYPKVFPHAVVQTPHNGAPVAGRI